MALHGTMDFRIRSASTTDIPAMHDLRKAVLENRLSDPRRITEASYLPYIAAGGAWVAETDIGIAGFAVIDALTGNVWALFIRPDAEGVGIGRALHAKMLGWAREQGISRLYLSTDKGTRAVKFYSRAGWMQVDTDVDEQAIFEKSLPT